jgi:hypothetical protein
MMWTRSALCFCVLLAIGLVTGLFPSKATAQLTDVDCGAFGQRPCSATDAEWWHGGLLDYGIGACDRGLEVRVKQCCGEVLGVEVCIPCGLECRNRTRWQGRADEVRGWWAYGALREQEKLARHEPLNWVMRIAAHNAYNNAADAYLLPNQQYSITDQLRMGARVIMLDVWDTAWGNKLSHGFGWPQDRHLTWALREIRDWLNANPGEVVFLEIEDYNVEGDGSAESEYVGALTRQLGQWILRRDEKPGSRWPSAAEMLGMQPQRRVVVLSQSYYDSAILFDGSWGDPYKFAFPYSKAQTWHNNDRDWDAPYENFVNRGQRFSEVYEDRSGVQSLSPTGYICDRDLDLGTPLPRNDCHDAAKLASCNVSIVGLDQFGCFNGLACLDIFNVDFEAARMKRLVWSWMREHRGWTENNKAAMLRSLEAGRWEARPVTEMHHFACGGFREGNPSGWMDTWGNRGLRTEWRITQATGRWEEGHALCEQEFPGSGLVFSVPVNWRQNEDLLHQALSEVPGKDVWLAYRDIDPTGEVYWDRDVRGQPPCVTGMTASPAQLWPPNHKMVPVQLTVSHTCPVSPQCRITEVLSSEPPAHDWVVIGDMGLELRAERAGTSAAGRRYDIFVECVVDASGRINRTAGSVLVPHDQRDKSVPGGEATGQGAKERPGRAADVRGGLGVDAGGGPPPFAEGEPASTHPPGPRSGRK